MPHVVHVSCSPPALYSLQGWEHLRVLRWSSNEGGDTPKAALSIGAASPTDPRDSTARAR
eukprot:5091657-Pyramimonas_sp.AAC.1